MPVLTIIPVVLALAGALGAGIFVLFKKFTKKNNQEAKEELSQGQKMIDNNVNFQQMNTKVNQEKNQENSPYVNLSKEEVSRQGLLSLNNQKLSR